MELSASPYVAVLPWHHPKIARDPLTFDVGPACINGCADLCNKAAAHPQNISKHINTVGKKTKRVGHN